MNIAKAKQKLKAYRKEKDKNSDDKEHHVNDIVCLGIIVGVGKPAQQLKSALSKASNSQKMAIQLDDGVPKRKAPSEPRYYMGGWDKALEFLTAKENEEEQKDL